MSNEIENLELQISLFLRRGVFFAGTMLLLGFIISAFEGSTQGIEAFNSYNVSSLQQNLVEVFTQHQIGRGVTYFGLFCLISLPILRVLMTAFIFIKNKERLMAFFALSVFVVLVLSFSLGFEI